MKNLQVGKLEQMYIDCVNHFMIHDEIKLEDQKLVNDEFFGEPIMWLIVEALKDVEERYKRGESKYNRSDIFRKKVCLILK